MEEVVRLKALASKVPQLGSEPTIRRMRLEVALGSTTNLRRVICSVEVLHLPFLTQPNHLHLVVCLETISQLSQALVVFLEVPITKLNS